MINFISGWSARLVIGCVIALTLIWQFFPPFQEVRNYEDLSFEEVVKIIGPPEEMMPEKHIAWRRQRILSFWYLVATYEPDEANGRPRVKGFTRLFCVGFTNYNFKFLV